MRYSSLLRSFLATLFFCLAEAQVNVTAIGGISPPLGTGSYPVQMVTDQYAKGPYSRVLFMSFDGMHQNDLVRFVQLYPNSTFATVLGNAVAYSQAKASSPSDSFPATTAIFTGAQPRLSGIWWDDAWDRSLYPGTSNCEGLPGAECDWSANDDMNGTVLDGGRSFNISIFPKRKTSWGTCETVYPHDFIRVNTVFEVARQNGLVTALAEKHPSYEFLNGNTGFGIVEGYYPEVSSVPRNLTSLSLTQAYDDLHWAAISNWTVGNFVNGTKMPNGGPSLYAANFQSLTYAQSFHKYADSAGAFEGNISAAIQRYDLRLSQLLGTMKACGTLNSTLLMIGSKQGQGPVNPNILKYINYTTMIEAAGVPVSLFTADDGGVMWLKNSSDAPLAKANLIAQKNITGVDFIYIGDEIWQNGFGTARNDPRVPDLIIGSVDGVFYTPPTIQVQNHGGIHPENLDVPLLAYNPNLKARNITEVVTNYQIAPTILHALGIDIGQLDAYRMEGTPVLPFLF